MTKYWPLICLILVAALAAGALASTDGGWMRLFMGLVLCQFAMLKLFHPTGFADGFQMYDLVAKKSRAYALIYPWIELGLGLAYLASFWLVAVSLLTLLIFGIGVVGVIGALRKGLDVRCACMGTVLDVPLSTVTLTEDFGMILMAIFMLIGK